MSPPALTAGVSMPHALRVSITERLRTDHSVQMPDILEPFEPRQFMSGCRERPNASYMTTPWSLLALAQGVARK